MTAGPPPATGLKFALDLSPAPWAGAQRGGDPKALRQAVERTGEIGRLADRAGIESLWAMEDPDGWDALAVLGALAQATERIRLGTGVVNPYYRHPSLLAASMATLDLLSGGRAFLGIGRGQGEWYATAMGIPVGRPVRALEEAFDLFRQWWAPSMRATSGTDATEFAVRGWERTIRPVQPHLPVYLAAVGPRAMALAGRHCDGVLFNDLASIPFMREAIAQVRDEAARAGRDPAALAFYARASVTITDNPEAVWERRKGTVAVIHALPGMERLLVSDGFDTGRIIADVRRAMRTDDILAAGGGFGDLRRGGDLAAARAAIPAELMRELVVAGTVADVRTRLREFREIGVTHVFLATPGPEATAESLAALIAALTAADEPPTL